MSILVGNVNQIYNFMNNLLTNLILPKFEISSVKFVFKRPYFKTSLHHFLSDETFPTSKLSVSVIFIHKIFVTIIVKLLHRTMSQGQVAL